MSKKKMNRPKRPEKRQATARPQPPQKPIGQQLSEHAVHLVRPWIAGENVTDALRRTKELNRLGLRTLIDHLGEHYKNPNQVKDAMRIYQEALFIIKKQRFMADVSVKLTSLGLDISPKSCEKNLGRLVEQAKLFRVPAWIDMESANYTDQTIGLYERMVGRHDHLAVAIQANLKRSREDVERLLESHARIRLVKGAYHERAAIAYQDRAEIRKNYARLMEILFKHGSHFAIATHDDTLIDLAKRLQQEYRKPFTFQFLMGIRDDLKKSLAHEGYRVGVYVPFGREWMPYMLRRVKERKGDLLLLAKSAIQEIGEAF